MDLQVTFIDSVKDSIIEQDGIPVTPVKIEDYVGSSANNAFVAMNEDCQLMLVRNSTASVEFVMERPDTTTYEGENGVFTGGRPPTR